MSIQSFGYRDNVFCCNRTPLTDLAEKVGTPCYVYSGDAIVDNYRAYSRTLENLDHEIHYSVKANSTLGVLSLLTREGAGFDVVSGGELFRVISSGGDPKKVVFSGVGKTPSEIEYALKCGVKMFNCESEPEAHALALTAQKLNKRPDIGFRVNPDINAETHPYIATGMHEHKFGIPIREAEQIYKRFASNDHLNLVGVSCHIGSQIFDSGPFLETLDTITTLVERLKKIDIPISCLDLGGGLAVAYRDSETTPSIEKFLGQLTEKLRGENLHLILEPGRSIVGPAGVLLTRVLYRKRSDAKEFIIVDAAMNDLIRPSLYDSYHEIVPLIRSGRPKIIADIVGPICETGDFLARRREIEDSKPGEVLAVCTAGAYGFALASNYNARPRPPEVLVQNSNFKIIRERESYADLIRGESL
ncbi:MAG: diaminopimelate decarboxylase [Solibacterales bacterium]|mgnify:CR=1 FL=1|nr:diaminopimelate decarboxylase [Bryobacterales bacterium]|tara:strand:+ start:6431 stop:7681 length:1251 start_codon:yes stop_codon:yes gene_type:complete